MYRDAQMQITYTKQGEKEKKPENLLCDENKRYQRRDHSCKEERERSLKTGKIHTRLQKLRHCLGLKASKGAGT